MIDFPVHYFIIKTTIYNTSSPKLKKNFTIEKIISTMLTYMGMLSATIIIIIVHHKCIIILIV